MNLNISQYGWTILTKDKCSYCSKVKDLIPEAKFIKCDDFLNKNRDLFLNNMKNIIGREYKKFQMVFLDKRFIGGFTETKKYVEELNTFNDDLMF